MMPLDPKHPGPTSSISPTNCLHKQGPGDPVSFSQPVGRIVRCIQGILTTKLGVMGCGHPLLGKQGTASTPETWWMQVARQVRSKRHLPIWPRTAPGKPLA